jgi:hypothetical protein
MATGTTTMTMAAGVNYTATTDNSTDWSAVTNNTYFYDKTNKIVYYKNNSGSVIGAYDTFTGGTVTGPTDFTAGLTATTISAVTYYNLPLDIYVTGATYSNNTFTFTNNTGGTFNTTFNDVTGLTVNGNIDVTSISPVDYINFNTNPTVPSATGGTLYFDSNENALSYKPITEQNDVTVNLGQESLIRVYNGLSTTILNGQVLHITGATSGIPTVALANASKLGTTFTESLAQTSGVATHDIEPGDYGFMTNFGIVRDLNTSAFTVGSEVFLSDTVDGALTNDPNSIELTSRISTVGYCLESHPTTGKILVVISNENPLQSLTQQEINVLLGNVISTGAYEYTGMTKASSTTVNVAPMRGWIVFNTDERATDPLVLNVYYSGGTNIPVTNINTSSDTYFLVNSGGTLYQQTTFPTPVERRNNIFLGRAVHPNKTDILNVEQSVDYDVSPLSSLRDLWTPIRLINQGVIISNNGSNLTFKTSSGTFWGNGIGWDTNQKNPNSITVPAQIPAVFYYTTQTGGTFTTTASTIDTTSYDVNGIITPIPGTGNYSTQRIYMSQSGVIRIQYGQVFYPTLAKAIAALPSELFIENADNAIDCILIGTITVKDGATDLSNIDDAVFSLVSKFGEVLGGTAGISTTTLQQAYDNSVNPEITTNSTLGAVQFKGGTGSNTDKNIIIENNSSVETAFIRADGFISGSSLNAPNITITGGTGVNWFSGNTSTDMLRVTQTGTGNAFVVEDETNPDNSPFVITSGGSVGIGTTSPVVTLDISGSPTPISGVSRNVNIRGRLTATGNNDTLIGLDIAPSYNNGSFTGVTNTDLRTNGINTVFGSSVGYGSLYGSDNDGVVQIKRIGSTSTTQMIFRPSSNATAFNGNYWGNIQTDGYEFKINSPYYGNVGMYQTTVANGAKFELLDVVGSTTNISNIISGSMAGGRILLRTFVNSPIILSGGSVGIGTTSPSATLDVSGKTRTTNFQMTSGATPGYFLTTDGSGNASWSPINATTNDLDPVLSILTTEPTPLSSNTIGDRYLIGTGATGTWSGRTNQIAEYIGLTPPNWFYTSASTDDIIFVTDTLVTYYYNGSNWIPWRGTAILQNGNTLSTAVNIGSNNNQNLTFRTSGQTRMTVTSGGNVGIGTTSPRQRLDISGNTIISSGLTAQNAVFSSSSQNVLTVIGSGNSTTSPLFSVQGSNGELFSVTDSLVGSLFSVNDISGLPIVEVFSDNTTLMGSYLAPSLNTTTRTSLTAGTNTVYSIPTSAYTGAFFEYTLISTGSIGARAGQIMSIWSGTSAQYTETTTNDIGTTTGVTFSVVVSGNNAVLRSSATTTGWTLKTIVRSI